LEIFSVAESEFAMAELLVEPYAFDYRLRALDALQLAVALELRNQVLVESFCGGRCGTHSLTNLPMPRARTRLNSAWHCSIARRHRLLNSSRNECGGLRAGGREVRLGKALLA
jgi:hypothetical protein